MHILIGVACLFLFLYAPALFLCAALGAWLGGAVGAFIGGFIGFFIQAMFDG